MTLQRVIFVLACLAWIYVGRAFGADVILNEYNAVNGSDYLNGGTAFEDEDGGYACDSYFGRVQGNGGDWFELVVSFDPEAGDWWINVQADSYAGGTYISNSGFPVTNDDWQLIIRNANDTVIYGPAGEGIGPQGGINSREIFRLEANPGDWITPESDYYSDGDSLSTFGSQNRWGATEFGFRHRQNFRPLRGYDLADFDEDGIADMMDFSILAKSWLAADNSPNWNPDCDISIPADNSIDPLDLAVLSHNWLKDNDE